MVEGNLYNHIAQRTGGEIYVGVVGPVRTGKSSLIQRFMELFVIPEIENPYLRSRVQDQLPQSGDGRTITTTEPKFVPEEAVRIRIHHTELFIRMADCVGYLVPGVLGHLEDGKERKVKTPWNEESVPFQEAAEMGTEKVICDHSTVGIVVTADGSFGEIPRENYVAAEEKTIQQLNALKKPFIILLNSAVPDRDETKMLAASLEEKYKKPVMAVDCTKMNQKEIEQIFQVLLAQFPVSEIFMELPEYMEALSYDHLVKASLIASVMGWMESVQTMQSVEKSLDALSANEHVKRILINRMEMATGRVYLDVELQDGLYYDIIGELLHQQVDNDKDLFLILREYARAKEAFDDMKDALYNVTTAGYGIVHPKLHQMKLGKPEVFKQGSKYGVRMVATAPCLHMIQTEISTEISPIVGSEQQSADLAKFLLEKFDGEDSGEEVWETNLFGKTLKELVTEQMDSKLTAVPDTLQFKVQRSLQKISNEGKDYFICIIL